MRVCSSFLLLAVIVLDCRPVVDRRLLTFFASPKKEDKRRRPRSHYPFGVPVFIRQKWEKFETRFAQTTKLSYPFLTDKNGSATTEFQLQKLVQNQLQNQLQKLRLSQFVLLLKFPI